MISFFFGMDTKLSFLTIWSQNIVLAKFLHQGRAHGQVFLKSHLK